MQLPNINPGIIFTGASFTNNEVLLLQNLASLTYSLGDIIYNDGTNFINLGIGTEGQTMQVVSGIPSWVTVSGGSSAWGSITGAISDQTDLQSALDAKQPLDTQLTSIAGLVPGVEGRYIKSNGLGGYEIGVFNTDVSNNPSVVANTAKVGITPTQASDILTNNAKVTYPSSDSTKVGFISVTQAVDLDTMESDIATNNAKVGITPTQAADIVTNNAKVGVTTEISNIVEDTTPQLGGELDAQAHSIGFTMQTATGDGTTTIDWGNGNHMDFTFGAFNETFTFTSPAKSGVYTLSLKQDSVGSRTATFPATVKWAGGTAPTLTTTATTGYDIISFRYDGTNYYGVASVDFS